MIGERVPDQELVQRSVAGDQLAFQDIVERYQGVVCATAYNGTGDFCASEDLAQETFFRAWHKLPQLREPNKLCGWLCGIARNLAQDYLRRRPRAAVLPLDGIEPVADAAKNPAEQAISREQERLLWSCLAELPENYREPLILFYREQQSVGNVAAALELSEDAVKQRLHRGRALLREKMAAFVEDALGRSAPEKTAFTAIVMTGIAALAPQTATAAGAAITAKTLGAAKGSAGLLSLFTVLIGPLLGLLGGAIGVYASYKTARSDRERHFVLRYSIWITVAVVVFSAGIVLFSSNMLKLNVPQATVLLSVWIGGYVLLILIMSIRANRTMARIRRETGTARPMDAGRQFGPDCTEQELRWAVLGSAFGLVVGGLAWIVVFAVEQHQFGIALLTGVFGVLLYAAIAVSGCRFPRYACTTMSAGAGLLTLYTAWFMLTIFGDWLAAINSALAPGGKLAWLQTLISTVMIGVFAIMTVFLYFKGRRIAARWK